MKFTAQAHTTILEAMAKLFPDCSKNTLLKMLKMRRVQKESRIVFRNGPLEAGQSIEVGRDRPLLPMRVEVLYSDRAIIVVNKPAGLLAVPLDKGRNANVLDILKRHFGTERIYAVHRLDREVSGVCIFARGKSGVFRLNELFRTHKLTRLYHALVWGKMEQRSGRWESFLNDSDPFKVRVAESGKDGKRAITHFRVLEHKGDYSLLELRLETGKKHQIRVHCAQAGYPIVGDPKYGKKEDASERLALHAHLLEIEHPVSGKPMQFRVDSYI